MPPIVDAAGEVSEGDRSPPFVTGIGLKPPRHDRSPRHRSLLARPHRHPHPRTGPRASSRHHVHLRAPGRGRARAQHNRRHRGRPASPLPAPDKTVPGAAAAQNNDRLRAHHPARPHQGQTAALATGASRDTRHCWRSLVRTHMGGREGFGVRHRHRGRTFPSQIACLFY